MFELRVLGCAKGDFLEGLKVYKERLTDPDDQSLICKCRGIIPDGKLEDNLCLVQLKKLYQNYIKKKFSKKKEK